MNKTLLRVAATVRWPLLLFIWLNAAEGVGMAADRTAAAHATRQELLGAWRLLSIQIEGPSGSTSDPFYNAEPTGMLIYDASGWMSVQIAGQHRPAMDAPASRPTHDTSKHAQLKAAVLDSYYAYFGTWEYDEATSTVTHHVKSSLIPGEAGMSYSQTVTLDDGHLIFTTRRAVAAGAAVQKKVWQRVSAPAP
jgi:hypothetical protein